MKPQNHTAEYMRLIARQLYAEKMAQQAKQK